MSGDSLIKASHREMQTELRADFCFFVEVVCKVVSLIYSRRSDLLNTTI